MISNRVELTANQISDLEKLVSGGVSTNQSSLELHGRDESAFPRSEEHTSELQSH